MDFTVRCNSLKCRTQLTDQAIVTTCSHIFCITCSENLGLAAATGSSRSCPACRALLPNPDDVVATSLNPTEDYKTSVLSGLSPTIIMECASRGLAFWSYQSTQEIVYQEYLAKTLTDKYATLNVQMDKLVNDANAEIDGLNQRFSQMQVDQEKLKQDNQTLLNALREKNRKFAQTNELYERLKRKEMTAATQHAAFNSVDDALQATTHLGSTANFSATRGNRIPSLNSFDRADSAFARSDQLRAYPVRNGELPKHPFFNNSHSTNMPGETPLSGHRTRLGRRTVDPSPNQSGSHVHRPSNLHPSHNQMPQNRRPLGPISGNASTARPEIHHSGYGLSAGMRAGSLHGGLSGVNGGEDRGGLWTG